MDVNIRANVRWNGLLYLPEGQEAYPQMTPRAELLVAQATPEFMELIRQGNSWQKLSDAVACVTAVPTTTAAHTLWNGEPAGGKSYVIQGLSWMCTTSAAAATKFGAVVQIDNSLYAAVPATADTAVAINSLNGKGAYSGRARSSHTVTVVDKGWMPLGGSIETALTATVGAALDIPINGGIILPPQMLLCVSVVAVNTTALGQLSFRWTELQLP